MPSIFETMFNGFADAIEDIRHKLVEEGWFGRETTVDMTALERLAKDNPDDPDLWAGREYMGLSEDERQSFDERWRVDDRQMPAATDKDIAPDQEHGLDR